MASAPWTKQELDALRLARTYGEWLNLSGSDRTYNSWEVKRRRVSEQEIERLEVAEAALDAPDNSVQMKKRFSDAVERTETAHLGVERVYPDIITFEPAFVDLETTNLKGNFGRVLCASVADMFGNVRTFRLDEDPWRRERRRDDSALCVGLREYLETFDFLVGWNSKMFDIPYLNTRLLIAGQKPLRMDIKHLDPMYKAAKGSLALHSKRLDAVAKTFRLPVQKTGLDPDIWQDAADGDREAMDYIVEHCEADVLVLRLVFHILKPLVGILHR